MIRVLAILLLAITGAGAVYGGALLVTDPTGWKLGISTSLLQYSPFEDFLIPGLILLVVIGAGSLMVCSLTIIKVRRYPTWVIFMGFLLAGYVSVQMLLIRDVFFIQIVFAVVGIGLVLLGIKDRSREYHG